MYRFRGYCAIPYGVLSVQDFSIHGGWEGPGTSQIPTLLFLRALPHPSRWAGFRNQNVFYGVTAISPCCRVQCLAEWILGKSLLNASAGRIQSLCLPRAMESISSKYGGHSVCYMLAEPHFCVLLLRTSILSSYDKLPTWKNSSQACEECLQSAEMGRLVPLCLAQNFTPPRLFSRLAPEK